MSGEQSYVLHLLRMLEESLQRDQRPAEAAVLTKIIDRIAAADSVDVALEELYAVEGWDPFALRLMWYSKRVKENPMEGENAALREYRVTEIAPLLGPMDPGTGLADAGGVATGELGDALKNFGYIIEELKARSFAGEEFIRLDGGLLEMTIAEADRLRQAGELWDREDIVRFADAFVVFVRYVLDREYFYDVRAINLIDTATTTLQSTLSPSATEDKYALLQTIDLLENPVAILE